MNIIYNKSDAIRQINEWAANGKAFLFIIDFEMEKIRLHLLDNLPSEVKYQIAGKPIHSTKVNNAKLSLERFPIAFEEYKKAYDLVLSEIKTGNSYLLNLTFPTPIISNYNLRELFESSQSKYKLYVEDEFLCFSPEAFVKIEDNNIYTFPMKGTIKADIPFAKERLLNNQKELAEHATITDLLRNDLSMIAKKVRVEKYRYLDKITANNTELYQASSKISGELPKGFRNQLGDLIFNILPAGSITGAPKKKTVEIIQSVEKSKRNYYTGIFGVYDGHNLDSAVMIRYIEKSKDQLIYKSGGGITFMSDAHSEYEELIDKIYVPIYRNHKNTTWKDSKPEVA